MQTPFTNTEHYPQDHPQIVALLGTPVQQAQKRYHGRTPAFLKIGRKVIYAGCDVNSWLAKHRVEPCAA